MQINSINQKTSPSFKSVYVTTSTANHGDYVEKEVIKPFNRNFKENILDYNDGFKDFKDVKKSTDVFVLMAGEGKRCNPLSKTQGNHVNKISFALPAEDGKNIHISDFALAQASPFLDKKGYVRVNASEARGTFADAYRVCKERRDQGLPQKNVIISCGDNIFNTSQSNPFELPRFMKDIINDPTKQLGLIGAKRNPEEVVGELGVLKVIPTDKKDVMQLDGFVEKPKTLEKALEFATPDGECVANTGMFVVKAEAMEWLMDELEEDPTFIAKDEKEPYDFAMVSKRVLEKYGKEQSVVKLVDEWEDAGNPKTYVRAIGKMQYGNFLSVFAPQDQDMIQESMLRNTDGRTLLASQNAVDAYGDASIYSDLYAPYGEKEKDTTINKVDGINVIV